jgi:hypothetical protein
MNSIQERSTRPVSTKEFAYAGAPLNLGQYNLKCPFDHQYILRMVVRADGGEYCLPPELDWLRDLFARAVESQQQMGIDHPFCYVTVRHGAVSSTTDDEWHVDGFSVRVPHAPEQNYLWADRDGTEWADLSVAFPEDFDARVYNVNHYLQQWINEGNVSKCLDNTMYCMDPYIVHRRPPSSSSLAQRTFVRVSFVAIEIDDIRNTQNPLLPRTYTRDGVAHRNRLRTY